MIQFLVAMPYRATEKTEARRVADRERIVRAAHLLVARGGFSGVAMSDVAVRAKVAVGTVYRHFPSKAALFAEVFRQASGREVTVMTAAGEARGGAAEQVSHAIRTFAERALEGPKLAWSLLAEPVDPAIEAERLTFRRAYRDALARFVAEGVRSGELPPQDPDLTAAGVVGAVGEAMLVPLFKRRRPADRKLLAELDRFVRRAIGAAPIPATGDASEDPTRDASQDPSEDEEEGETR